MVRTVALENPPFVDLSFPILSESGSSSSTLLADHGYPLFAAIAHALPFLHGNDRVAIHPVAGRLAGLRRIQLTDSSGVTLRLPSDLIDAALPLAGATLDVEGSRLRLGPPRAAELVPAATLRSRLVVIKGMLDAQALAAAARRQLDALGVAGRVAIPARQSEVSFEATGVGSPDPFERRTMKVRDKVIVGYALTIDELTAEESVCVQEHGVGGRQRFGCGVFVPEERP